jgi:hypothetical protein
VFDSTFSNPEHARRLIELALGNGKTTTVHYVFRPLEETFRAMLDRAQLVGRVVTIEQLIGSHRGAARAVRELSREFARNPDVEFAFFDNSAMGASEGTIELTAPRTDHRRERSPHRRKTLRRTTEPPARMRRK